MLSLKQGVEINGLQPEILLGIIIVNSVFSLYGYSTVITSLMEGQHMEGSKHYKGLAVDIRSHIIDQEELSKIIVMCQNALGENFKLILEDTGLPNEHLHLQVQA